MVRDSRAAGRAGEQTQQWDKRGSVAPVLSARRASEARASSSDVVCDLCEITVHMVLVIGVGYGVLEITVLKLF